MGAVDEKLLRNAAAMDTGTAHAAFFNQGDARAVAGGAACARNAARTATDYE